MRGRKVAGLIAGGIALLGAAYAFQQGPREHVHTWQEYPAFEYNDFPIPPDYQEKTEWAYARLMYPTMPGVHARNGYGRFGTSDWTQGGRGAFWTMDYPRSDRHFSAAVRRLTRIHARSVEQPINLDEGDQYDWPWLYAVEVGHWNLTGAQVKAFREYLDRGGFFMCDDFHGTEEWAVFMASMSRVFPDREIVNIPNDDPIFHTVFNLDDRYQVPGEQYVRSGRTYEYDGYKPYWRGIYDDKHRLMVAICHDMDLGDSWEHADNPEYPQQFSALGVRIGVNYLVYAMTH
jgi:Domain of unknown function (DUF4159)